MTELECVYLVAQAADAKRGEDIVALDVRRLTTVTDYFVLVSATNSRMLDAICEHIIDELSLSGITGIVPEGESATGWVVLDIGGVVVHLMSEEMRNSYNLEKVWHEAIYLDNVLSH